MRNLYLTNTLTRRKELFVPIHPGHVGMYLDYIAPLLGNNELIASTSNKYGVIRYPP